MKIGDMVIYRMQTLPEIGLIHDHIYTVQDVAECGGCKDNLHIDVGLTHDGNFVFCPDCQTIVCMDDRYFLHHSAFRLIGEKEDKFSMAGILHDIFG